MSDNYTDAKTGQEITPELIEKQLAALGVPSDTPKSPTQETEEKAEESKEEVVLEKESVPSEDAARKLGWKPEGGELSAEEFIGRQDLYDEIKDRGKTIKEMQATLEGLKVHMDSQKEAGRTEAMAQLEAQRVEAIEIGNVEGVNAAEAAMQEASNVAQTPQAEAFIVKHKDWINDPSLEAEDMRNFVQERDKVLGEQNLSHDEQIKIIEKDLAYRFPSRFKDEVSSPNTVASDAQGAGATSKKGLGFKDLNSEQKTMFRHFEKNIGMKLDKYIADLQYQGVL